MKICTLLIVFIQTIFWVNANHITNGNIYYTYNGRIAGNEQYIVELILYRDCDVSTENFDAETFFAVYTNNVKRDLYRTVNAFLTEEKDEKPTILSTGSPDYLKCYKKGTYRFLLTLPAFHTGYTILWQRCCRRIVSNIMAPQGISVTATIPPFNSFNNSPRSNMSANTVVFGLNAYTTINFANTDADGDSLSYAFTYLHGSTTNNSVVKSYPDSFPVLSRVNYRNQFDYNYIGGNKSELKINSDGIATVFSLNTGIHVIGIEIFEWRNGITIASHKREYVLLILKTGLQNTARLAAKQSIRNRVELEWSYNGTDSSTKQLILKRLSSNVAWDTLAFVDSNVRVYTDTNTKYNTTYQYLIATTKAISTYTNIADITITKPLGTVVLPETEMNIYPNPFTDYIIVNTTATKIEVIDMQAKVIFEETNQQQFYINTATWPNGTYIVRVYTPQKMSSYRIVKQ